MEVPLLQHSSPLLQALNSTSLFPAKESLSSLSSYLPLHKGYTIWGMIPDSALCTCSCTCVEKSPQAAMTEQTISTASARLHIATPPTSSTNHILPIAAFLGTTTDSALTQGRGTPLYTAAGKRSEKCGHRRAEKFPLRTSITSSELLTHQGENLAVGKNTL